MTAGLVNRFLKSVVYPNFFIACCATGMAWETGYVLHLPKSAHTLPAVFLSTLAAYGFHALMQLPHPSSASRHQWNQRHRRFLIIQSGASLLLLLWLLFPLINQLWLWLIGGLAVFLYSAPLLPGTMGNWFRTRAFGKTAYLAAVWTYATSYLPIALSQIDIDPISASFMGYRFFLIYTICILFDQRDLEEDRIRGVRTLPVRVGTRNLRNYLLFSIVAATGILLWLQLQLGISAIWPLALPILLLIPLAGFAAKHRSDFLYFVVLDGLMALSAGVHAVIKWLTL
jgi:4-hydroxybenzoate polyprenyltransferase